MLLALGLAAGCRGGREETIETEIKTERDAGGHAVRTEAEAAGRVPGGGQLEGENRVYIGKVTQYEPGKRLEITATDGDRDSFDLAERGTQVTVQPRVEIGKTVEVLVEKQKDRPKRVNVVARVR